MNSHLCVHGGDNVCTAFNKLSLTHINEPTRTNALSSIPHNSHHIISIRHVHILTLYFWFLFLAEVYCGPVPQISNGFAIGSSNVTYLGTATYQCYAGFAFPSGKATEVITCLASGKWEKLPLCLGKLTFKSEYYSNERERCFTTINGAVKRKHFVTWDGMVVFYDCVCTFRTCAYIIHTFFRCFL